MPRFLTLPATLLAAVGTAAMADGPAEMEPSLVIPETAIEQPWNFTGLSVGAFVGYGMIESDAASADGEDPTAGARVAFDYQFGRTVLGVGAQYVGVDSEQGVFRMGPRAGVAFGRNMVYGTAGYAEIYTDNPRVEDSSGYFLGVGAERFLNEKITVGFEFDYDKFEDFDDSIYEDLDATAYSASVSLNFRF